MNEMLPTIFAITLVIVTVVLSVVGVQIIMVLIEVKKTLRKANILIDTAELKFNKVTNSVNSLGGAITGIKAGMKVVEGFMSWLNRNKDNDGKEEKK